MQAPRIATLVRPHWTGDHIDPRVVERELDAIGVRAGESFVIAHPEVMELPVGPGPSHRDDPQTSEDAAVYNLPRAGTQRRACFDAVLGAGLAGKTFDELVVGLGMYSAQKRLHDLKKGGWVVGSGRTRPTRTGAQAEVYIATEKARARALTLA